jgi:hypothetical protein
MYVDVKIVSNLLKLFQEWGKKGIKEKGGGIEFKYDIFDLL